MDALFAVFDLYHFWFQDPFERAFLTLNIIILNGAFHLQTWSKCSSFSVLFYVRACVFCVFFFSEKEIQFLWLKIPAQRVGRTARFIALSCMSCFPSSDRNRVHLKQVNLLRLTEFCSSRRINCKSRSAGCHLRFTITQLFFFLAKET